MVAGGHPGFPKRTEDVRMRSYALVHQLQVGNAVTRPTTGHISALPIRTRERFP